MQKLSVLALNKSQSQPQLAEFVKWIWPALNMEKFIVKLRGFNNKIQKNELSTVLPGQTVQTGRLAVS
jgi:hypothetical protein